jgi:hypothetical protein
MAASRASSCGGTASVRGGWRAPHLGCGGTTIAPCTTFVVTSAAAAAYCLGDCSGVRRDGGIAATSTEESRWREIPSQEQSHRGPHGIDAVRFLPTLISWFLRASFQESTQFLLQETVSSKFPLFINLTAPSAFCLVGRVINKDRNYH